MLQFNLDILVNSAKNSQSCETICNRCTKNLKRVIQKTAEGTGDLIDNKISSKIKKL